MKIKLMTRQSVLKREKIYDTAESLYVCMCELLHVNSDDADWLNDYVNTLLKFIWVMHIIIKSYNILMPDDENEKKCC